MLTLKKLKAELDELEKVLGTETNDRVEVAKTRIRDLREEAESGRRDWLYDFLEEPARWFKIILQMGIGFWTVVLIGHTVLQTIGDGIPDNLPPARGTLELIGAGLAVAAAVELAYALYTDGPDEAVDPLILGVAAALAIHLASPSNPSPGYAWLTVAFTVCLGLLFAIRERFVQEPELSRFERFRDARRQLKSWWRFG